MIPAQLSLKKIISCSIGKMKTSWYFDSCTLVPENDYQLSDSKNGTFLIFWFLHSCPWERVSAVQSKKRKIPDILIPAHFYPWTIISFPIKKWKHSDIVILAQLFLRTIISSQIQKNKISWYFDSCTAVPEKNYQLFNRNNENFLIFWFLHICTRERLSTLRFKKWKFPDILIPAQLSLRKLFNRSIEKKNSDILIPAHLYPRMIISSQIKKTKISWYLDSCTAVPEKNYQLFNRKNENFLILWFLHICIRERL